LSYKLKRALQMCAGQVLTTDPFVTSDPAILPFDQVVERSDILIVHAAFRLCGRRPQGQAGGGRLGLLKNANVVS